MPQTKNMCANENNSHDNVVAENKSLSLVFLYRHIRRPEDLHLLDKYHYFWNFDCMCYCPRCTGVEYS